MIIKKYKLFKESLSNTNTPTYKDCVEMCNQEDSPFYETKLIVENYRISIFNYRLASYNNFIKPVPYRPELKGYEMRGLTFVFNEDGSIFKRYLLLEKFFNINQVPESMYSIVKNYRIKFTNNKEDGSIATFIKLPNGNIVGKSKMGFDNEQAIGINRIYRNNKDVKSFTKWCLNNNIIPIYEYVAPTNKIVLRYMEEELILLRLRDNATGKHIDLREHLDKIGSIKVAPFEDDFNDLDHLMELVAKQIDKEGCVVTAEDENGNDFFFKLKTPWYCERHGLLTNDIYREHVIIGYILDDKIDDILGQIPEDEKEAHERINKIILIVKRAISDKMSEMDEAYRKFVSMGANKKDYAINHRLKNKNFAFVMALDKGDRLKKMSREEILDVYDDMESYEEALKRSDPYELAKEWVRDQTKRLNIAREWLREKDPTLFFQDIEESDDDN
jgi:T4 RnlA family RNA ligase